MNDPMGDLDKASSPGFPNPDQSAGFKPKAIYDSATPISTAQDVTTTSKIDVSCGAPVYNENKMSAEEQLAFRNKAFNAAQTQNGDPVVPDFQAGEIEY